MSLFAIIVWEIVSAIFVALALTGFVILIAIQG